MPSSLASKPAGTSSLAPGPGQGGSQIPLPVFEPQADGIVAAFKAGVRVDGAIERDWSLFVQSLAPLSARRQFAGGFVGAIPTGAQKKLDEWKESLASIKLVGTVAVDRDVFGILFASSVYAITAPTFEDLVSSDKRLAQSRKLLVDYISVAHPEAFERFRHLPEIIAAMDEFVERLDLEVIGELAKDLSYAAGVGLRSAMVKFLALNGLPAQQGAMLGTLAGSILMEVVTDLLVPLPLP